MVHIRDSVLVTLFLFSNLHLEPLVAQECQPEYLASSLVGSATDIQVVGSTAFVTQGTLGYGGGVQTIDVSDPDNPTTLGFVATPGGADAVAVEGTFAYVADGVTGLAVVDVSDPRAPEIVRMVATPGRAVEVELAADCAYVAVRPIDWWDQPGPSSLEIFDLQDPGNPQHRGSAEIPGRAVGLGVSGRIAYVTDFDSGLTVVDVENPESPQTLRTVETPGTAWCLSIAGDLAFVADGESGLTIIDVLSADNPILTTVELSGSVHYVQVSGGVAYLMNFDSSLQSPWGLVVLDVTDPASVEILGAHELPGAGLGLRVVENRAYVAAGFSGMHILDVENPAQPREVGSVEPPGFVDAVVVSKGKALVGGSRLAVIDVENPDRLSIPRIIEAPGVGYIRTTVLVDDLAYLGTSDGLSVLDFADPHAPRVLGSISTPEGASGIAVADQFAYIAVDGFSGRLFIVDVGDPHKPRIISSISTSGSARDVAVSGGVAYVAIDSGGLRLIDVRDPENPRVIDDLFWQDPDATMRSVTVSRGFAYVGAANRGLVDGTVSIVDVADPDNARVVANVDLPGDPPDIVVERGRAYVARGGGLSVIDVEDPTRPRVIGSVELRCGVGAVAIVGRYAYVAAGPCGLKVIDISSCQSASSIFRRGDCNDDGEVDLSDAVCILGWLYLGEEEPGCVAVTNTNGSELADLSDAVYLLGHLFLGGPAPVEPFPECGPGQLPADEEMGCEVPPKNCPK